MRQSDEQVEYRGTLRIEETGENPVLLELSFVPPHPFLVNMPMQLSIQAGSITGAYSKLVRLLNKHGVDLDG